MRTTTKEQVKEAFNSLPPFSYISVIYGKGKNRTYKAFDLNKKREDTIGHLLVFLSEKSLTHNISSVGFVKGWNKVPNRIEVRLTESKKAILNSNIDADMIQTIIDCVNEIDERSENWDWVEWYHQKAKNKNRDDDNDEWYYEWEAGIDDDDDDDEDDDEIEEPTIPSSTNEQTEFELFGTDIRMP